MPIYEYQCNDCCNTFEYLVLRGHEPEECDHCKGQNIQRQMSACGFFSKGSGGETMRAAAGSSTCGSCSAGSCAGCGH